jgi:putative spermidine/putrescine transport system substrate-binding protein
VFQRQVGSIHRSNQLPWLPHNCGAACPSEGSAMTTSRLLAAAASALVVIGLMACAPPEKKDTGNQTESGVNAREATSAADFGGMDGLVKAAKAEGALNVIALPPDWANYKEIIDTFSAKYGIKVNSAQPDANSQDEINAANQQKGRSTAPDVFDLGQAIALANTNLFAPYKVATFDDIPAQFKDPNGTWVNDYGGYESVGYDSSKVPEITAFNDLLRPEFKGKVALNGDPTTASAAANGVLMAAMANGGSVDDIAPGVDFFVRLKDAGNFVPVDPTPATIESGQTPVVIDWDYLNSAETKKLPTWKVFVPSNALVGGYYFQAINKDGPHPAAARLWQEFLYSDEGQNLFLKGLARPVRADAMEKAGTVDKTLLAALPAVQGPPVVPTDAQSKKMAEYLGANWSKVIS